MSFYNRIYSTKTKCIGKDVDYAIVVEDRILLIFKGSNSKQDWKIDFNFPAKLYKKYLVHRGITDAWKSANDVIMKELMQVCSENPDLPVFIIGHSLGGAYAILACEDFNYRTGIKPNVITYGCPKFISTGVKHFRNSGHIIQYVIKNDLVPKVVPFYGSLRIVRIGEFNLVKMFTQMEKNHTSYGEYDIL